MAGEVDTEQRDAATSQWLPAVPATGRGEGRHSPEPPEKSALWLHLKVERLPSRTVEQMCVIFQNWWKPQFVWILTVSYCHSS